LSHDQQLLSMRVDALFETTFVAGALSFAGALLASMFYWSDADAIAMGLWVVVTALLLILRVPLIVARKRNVPAGWSARVWANLYVGLMFASGVAWGAAGWWILSRSTDTHSLLFVSLALGGVTFSVPNAVYWPAHLAFHFPLLTLSAIGFASSNTPDGEVLAGATVILCMALIVLGRRIAHSLVRAMELSIENGELAATLAKQTQELAYSNRILEELSATDPLTGLSNRRGLLAELQSAPDIAPAGLLMIDVDHFKSYNDTFGHAEGDACLRAVAAALSRTAQDGDLIARLGGEEFVAILPHVGEDQLGARADRWREAIERLGAEHGLKRPITASIGCSVLQEATAATLTHAMKAADAALYQAKRDGRNRISLFKTV